MSVVCFSLEETTVLDWAPGAGSPRWPCLPGEAITLSAGAGQVDMNESWLRYYRL